MTTVRPITDVEVDAYWAHGWVRLASLVDPTTCATLVEERRHLPAPDTAISNAVDSAFSQVLAIIDKSALARAVFLHPVMGDNVSRLLHNKPTRVEQSNLTVKQPAGACGAHGPTPFHQDFAYMPMDRSEMLTVWIALAPVSAEMGPLRFLDRSHHEGSLGRSFLRDGDETQIQHPWLDHCSMTSLLAMRPGDATVHSALTVHGASDNSGRMPRIVMTAAYFAADTLYTGAPFARTDGLGMAVNAPFDHPNFPLVPMSNATGQQAAERRTRPGQ